MTDAVDHADEKVSHKIRLSDLPPVVREVCEKAMELMVAHDAYMGAFAVEVGGCYQVKPTPQQALDYQYGIGTAVNAAHRLAAELEE